jgi:hypothetical protein
MFGRKEYVVEVTKAHDGAKLFHHKTEFTLIKVENVASVIPKVANSTKERKVQLHLPIVDNTRKKHMPKVNPTYVVGTSHPLANLPKQKELHS